MCLLWRLYIYLGAQLCLQPHARFPEVQKQRSEGEERRALKPQWQRCLTEEYHYLVQPVSLVRSAAVLRTPYSAPIKCFVSTQRWSSEPFCLLGALCYLWPLRACCLRLPLSAGLVQEWQRTEADHVVTSSVPELHKREKKKERNDLRHRGKGSRECRLDAATSVAVSNQPIDSTREDWTGYCDTLQCNNVTGGHWFSVINNRHQQILNLVSPQF